MTISHLPLQDMIASVVKTASDRLVHSERTANKIKIAASSDSNSYEEETCEGCGKEKDACECGAKMASFTERDFVLKLAEACDFITENVDNIAPPNRGVLGTALAKLAENGLPTDRGVSVPATNPEGALEVTTPPNGEQQYKKDKPAGEDAAASQAGTAETKSNMPGGTTQISNNMDKAPGQGSGSVPSATYPSDGPFHSGSKTAGALGNAARRGAELLKGGKKMPFASGGSGRSIGKVMDKRPGNSATALTQRTGAGTEARKSTAARGAAAVTIGGVGASFAGGKKKEKTAAELARELILNKLAGEDVMQANISGSKDAGPLVGEGELDALVSDDTPSNPTDGSGYGNDQRRLIQSNDAAINYTKGEAKKPQGKQMSEVLENPAFSPEHDSKLREQLQNAGEAGVKIAGAAAATSFLKQAAVRGVLTQETVNSFKAKMKTASVPTAASGTTSGPTTSSDAAVTKLRNMMDMQRKSKASMGDDGGIY